MLQLYNTLSKKKEKLTPIKENHIGLYVCGMTVYDHCHLGHARVWVVFDALVRYLQHLGYTVNYVRNITDVDDKIIHRAVENRETITALTARMIRSMHDDMAALQLLRPTVEPRATGYIPHMLQLIQQLIKKGYAYVTPVGDVYYHINQFKPYGHLAQQNLNDLMTGARVAIDHHKKHPLDFVLWKKTADTDTISWESPWGLGRPGWHLECSAMALHHLGESFDIHGGGADLQFPHHQNEVAQSEAVTQKIFVNTWMHVGFVQINQDKMSKSTGNALSIKELLPYYPGEVIRYFLLTSHYRSPLSYQEAHLQTAAKGLKRLYKAIAIIEQPTVGPVPTSLFDYETKFHKALADDLNTPVALSILFDIARQSNRLSDTDEAVHWARLLKRLAQLLGLLQQTKYPTLTSTFNGDDDWINAQIKQRQLAREQKQFALADQIRQSLLDQGILIEDTKEGTRWYSRAT